MVVEEDWVLVDPSEIMAGLIEMSSSEASVKERLAEAKDAIRFIANHNDFMDYGPAEIKDKVAVIAHEMSYIETVMDSLVFFTNKTLGEFMPDKED